MIAKLLGSGLRGIFRPHVEDKYIIGDVSDNNIYGVISRDVFRYVLQTDYTKI